MQGANAGTQRLTTDGVVGTSGSPTRVFFAELLSAGGGTGNCELKNGTSTSGTAFSEINGTAASKTDSRFYGNDGMYFPAGCWVSFMANATSVLVAFKQEVL